MGYRSDLQHAYLDFYQEHVYEPLKKEFPSLMEEKSKAVQIRKTLAMSIYGIGMAAPLAVPSIATHQTMKGLSKAVAPKSYYGTIMHEAHRPFVAPQVYRHSIKRGAMRFASRAIPYVGWALLAYDIYSLGKWLHGRN